MKKSFLFLASATICLLLCWFTVPGAGAQADQTTGGGEQTHPATTPTKTPDANKPGTEGANKTGDAAKTGDQTKPAETKPPANGDSQVKLTIVEEEKHTFWELVEGNSETVSLEVTTDEKDGVNLARISFAPAQGKQTPAEANQVRVVGPAAGYPGLLKSGEKLQISLVFPPHRTVGQYQANLTYATSDAPMSATVFHTATVQVGMMRRWLAGSIAGVFCLVIVLLTFLVSKAGNKPLNFFQSPDGSYSVSKFQIWIWTLVVVFAFSYLFLWQDGDIKLPSSTWALLGISVASTGIAKVVAVKQEEKKGGDVAPAPPPVDGSTPPSPTPPTPGTPAAAAAAAGITKALTAVPRPNWLTSMLSDGDQLSLMRIQMFAWTMVAATMYVVYLFQQQALWDVPAGLLVLMGVSHGGYLVDKGAAPDTDMQCESVQPNSVKAAPNTTKNDQVNLIILGQNFRPADVKCFVGGVELSPTNVAANRIEAPLPAGKLDAGKKYDVVVQQPGEDAEVMTQAFEVTT